MNEKNINHSIEFKLEWDENIYNNIMIATKNDMFKCQLPYWNKMIDDFHRLYPYLRVDGFGNGVQIHTIAFINDIDKENEWRNTASKKQTKEWLKTDKSYFIKST